MHVLKVTHCNIILGLTSTQEHRKLHSHLPFLQGIPGLDYRSSGSVQALKSRDPKQTRANSIKKQRNRLPSSFRVGRLHT